MKKSGLLLVTLLFFVTGIFAQNNLVKFNWQGILRSPATGLPLSFQVLDIEIKIFQDSFFYKETHTVETDQRGLTV